MNKNGGCGQNEVALMEALKSCGALCSPIHRVSWFSSRVHSARTSHRLSHFKYCFGTDSKLQRSASRLVVTAQFPTGHIFRRSPSQL